MTTNIQPTKTRDERGRFLTLPEGAAPLITSASARDMVKKRTESYRRAALKRIVGEVASIDPTVSTGADAFGVIASRQVQLMMDAEKPDMNGLEKLYKMMVGILGAESQRDHETATPPNGTVQASVDTLLALVEQIEQHKRIAVDKARAIDAE